MGDKKGIFGRIVDAAHDEFFEGGDAKPKTAKVTTPAPSAPLAPMLTPAAPAAPLYVPPAAPAMVAPAAATISPTPAFAIAAEPVDPDALNLVQGAALPDTINGHRSAYVLFKRMHDALGKPADLTGVLSALAVTDQSITPQAILDDLAAHLSLLDAAHEKADGELNAYAEQKLGGTDAQIKALQDANDAATKEIQRHQQEMSERITQIAQLQQTRAQDEAAIARGRQRAITAEGVVRGQLQQIQQILSR